MGEVTLLMSVSGSSDKVEAIETTALDGEVTWGFIISGEDLLFYLEEPVATCFLAELLDKLSKLWMSRLANMSLANSTSS